MVIGSARARARAGAIHFRYLPGGGSARARQRSSSCGGYPFSLLARRASAIAVDPLFRGNAHQLPASIAPKSPPARTLRLGGIPFFDSECAPWFNSRQSRTHTHTHTHTQHLLTCTSACLLAHRTHTLFTQRMLFALPPGVLTGAYANSICCFLRPSDAQRLASTCSRAKRALRDTVGILRQREKKKAELRSAARLEKMSPEELAYRKRNIKELRANQDQFKRVRMQLPNPYSGEKYICRHQTIVWCDLYGICAVCGDLCDQSAADLC